MQPSFARIRNVLLVIVVAALLLCVGAHKVFMWATGTSQSEVHSTLEGRTYQAFPKLTIATISSGDFQSEFEQYAADALPERDNVLLANAALQRQLIKLANTPFRFDAYPTFYGSDYVYSPRIGTVAERTAEHTATKTASIKEAASSLGRIFAEKHDVRWTFALIDRSSTTAALPAHALMSDTLDYQALKKTITSNLPASVRFVDLSYTDEEEYLRDYFLTDHHWQVTGARKAYEKICKVLGKAAVRTDDTVTLYSGPYWGSAARSGLCAMDTGDAVYDYPLHLDNLQVFINGKQKSAASLGYVARSGGMGYAPKQRFSNCYAELFHADYGTVEIRNPDAKSADTLLIVGDSFTNNAERFFAQSYARVIAVDPRYYDGTLKQVLATEHIDDALFLLSEPNFSNEDMAEFLN